jgi:hypothetical protein
MIKLIEINDKRYPFLFDMEVVWFLTSSGKIELVKEKEIVKDEKGNEIEEEKISGFRGEYNDMMELFLIANRSAIEYEGKGESLKLLDLKNGIRKNPKLYVDLQRELNESEVMKMFSELEEKEEEKEGQKTEKKKN